MTRGQQQSLHRTKRVRIRGLALDPPGDDRPVEVCVNDQADWDLIYKNPAIRVKCVVDSCGTLLTAKRMSQSGLRFLAVRAGGCSHNFVEMPIRRDEVEQDPSRLVDGGGPEGQEHLWMKGRLFKIVQSLGQNAVVEHSLTRADVFLPDRKLVLEYQRWPTDFRGREAKRSSTGAAFTLWMLPWQPPTPPQTARSKAFNREVFQNGGIYVAVRNQKDRRELQQPWEIPSQERTARLYARGSIVVFDPTLGILVRRERSLATILAQIISGERQLVQTAVFSERTGRTSEANVWALRDDLARVEAQKHPQRTDAAKYHTGVDPSSHFGQPITPNEVQPGGRPIPGDAATESALKASVVSETVPVSQQSAVGSPSGNLQPRSRPSPWWKLIIDWLRRT